MTDNIENKIPTVTDQDKKRRRREVIIILAIIMFVVEVKVPSHGALTVGGVIAMLVGSIMLIDSLIRLIEPTTLFS